MNTWARAAISVFALMGGLSLQAEAFAQAGAGMLGGRGGNEVPSPSQETAPLPDVAPVPSEPQVKSLIPALPLSSPCKPDDVEGLWKLVHVFEDPQGAETVSFSQTPEQFILFRINGLYGRYNDSRAMLAPKFIIDQINSHANNILQYLVQDKGIIYFYQDKVANDLQACFIVARTDTVFQENDMLLMPPKGQVQGRLVKHYTRIWSRQQKPAAPNQQQMYRPGQTFPQGQNYPPGQTINGFGRVNPNNGASPPSPVSPQQQD